MPVDNSHATSTRRSQRKMTDEELKDIEIKRIRGELSCAECRRLKLRCDKRVPCGSCIRRGCESICPCGILSTGQGSRFILADTGQLHKKIAEMSDRIRQLEDGLAILQATVSDRPHPLLKDDLLRVKFGAEALDPKQSGGDDDREDNAQGTSIDALGTLTLEESGESRYFGLSAGSETLMMASESGEGETFNEAEDIRFPLAPEPEKLSNLFPFTRIGMLNCHSVKVLVSLLPPRDRASSLCKSYCDHATLFYRPIKQRELFNSTLPQLYPVQEPQGDGWTPPDESDRGEDAIENHTRPHELATAFFIFALGALLDLDLPPYNAEAEHFYDLGRAALSLQAVYESPSLSTVQAIGLMATYHTLAGRKYSRDSAWCIMSFAAKLAQSIGLHRDSARWQMDAATVQKRRNLFWETFAADVSHSLALGRPPAIHLSYVDCEFPLDEEASLDNAGKSQNGFWRMKHMFSKNIFNAVAEATLIAKAPSYKTVLDLDRKVREISFPVSFKPYVTLEEGEEEFYSSSLSLRDFYASQHRTVTMLYLHRSFFAQAVLDHPANPLLSHFAPSFLTAYRCASIIIRASAHQFERCAAMAMRVWFLLYHTFSAAVIVGTAVTRSPNSTVSSSALLDLDIAVDLFEATAKQSYRAKIALGVLRRLREKAVRSYNNSCSLTLPAQINSKAAFNESMVTDSQMPNIFSAQSLNDAEDELAIFGGQTRVLTRKARNKSTGTVAPFSVPKDPIPALGTFVNFPIPPTAPFNPSSMSDVSPDLTEYHEHDSIGISYNSHSSSSSANARPTAWSPRNGNSRRSGPGSPSSREMGEMYRSFMEYLARRTVSKSSAVPGSMPPSMIGDRPPAQRSASSSTSSSDATPPASANQWEQATGSHAQLNLPAADVNALGDWPALSLALGDFEMGSIFPNQSFNTLSASESSVNATGASAVMTSTQGGIGGGTFDGRMDPTFYPGYGVESRLGSGLNLPGGAPPALSHNSMDSIVEMGLTSESGIDERWLAFMHECRIMEHGGARI